MEPRLRIPSKTPLQGVDNPDHLPNFTANRFKAPEYHPERSTHADTPRRSRPQSWFQRIAQENPPFAHRIAARLFRQRATKSARSRSALPPRLPPRWTGRSGTRSACWGTGRPRKRTAAACFTPSAGSPWTARRPNRLTTRPAEWRRSASIVMRPRRRPLRPSSPRLRRRPRAAGASPTAGTSA
jgi:hypothetical protein